MGFKYSEETLIWIHKHIHTLSQMKCPHLCSLGTWLGGWGWVGVQGGGFGSLCGGYRVRPKYISAWKLLSHRPLIRLQKCGIDFSLFQMKKEINIFQLSTMLLNFLCHLVLRRPRKSRGKGQESTRREKEVFPAICHHASCPCLHRPFRSLVIHSFIYSRNVCSSPGTVPAVGNSVTKKPGSGL